MAETPHYAGHRGRLRARFLRDAGESLPDYEIVELILFGAHPRGDVKPLAKRLLDRFDGRLGDLLAADPADIRRVPGAGGDATVAALKAVHAAMVRAAREPVAARPVISTGAELLDYCAARLGREKTEQFRVLFLDRRNRLMADEAQGRGTVDHTPVYPREVVKRALELGASALIMVHNHPSGDPTPSDADVAMTREVAEAARRLGITLHDHVVVGRDGHVSFKSRGLL